MKPLLEFANMKGLGGGWSPEVLKLRDVFSGAPSALQEKHGKSFLNILINEWARFCRRHQYYAFPEIIPSSVMGVVSRSINNMVFLLRDMDAATLASLKHDKASELHFNMPSENTYYLRSELCFAEEQSLYRGFLSGCSKGYLDLDFINSRIDKIWSGNSVAFDDLHFDFKGSMWKPSVLISAKMNRIEDFIDFYGIIVPFLTGSGKSFSMVRECAFCHDFFLAKSSKAMFCSDRCRGWYHVKERK